MSDSFDRESKNYHPHGTAKCKHDVGDSSYPYKEFEDEPMVVVRTYPNAQTALINCVYYHRYGVHRCNLVLDQEMGVGVYAYTDMQTLIDSINWNLPDAEDTVIGVLYGYLHKTSDSAKKVSIDPRSCKIVGFSLRLKNQREHLLL